MEGTIGQYVKLPFSGIPISAVTCFSSVKTEYQGLLLNTDAGHLYHLQLYQADEDSRVLLIHQFNENLNGPIGISPFEKNGKKIVLCINGISNDEYPLIKDDFCLVLMPSTCPIIGLELIPSKLQAQPNIFCLLWNHAKRGGISSIGNSFPSKLDLEQNEFEGYVESNCNISKIPLLHNISLQ